LKRTSPTNAPEASERALFGGASARAILTRIVPGDPLGLRARVARRLRERALFGDGDRVHLSALASCARHAGRRPAGKSLDAWLNAQVDAAIDEHTRDLARPDQGRASAVSDLARPLELDADALRVLCQRFNALPSAERRAFVAVVLEGTRGEELDELARRVLLRISAWTKAER